MRKLILVVMTAVAWFACSDARFKRCVTGTECAEGETCIEAVCVLQGGGSAGGSAGASTGGGSSTAGGTAGGSTAGAGTSGGSAGGLNADDAGPSVQLRVLTVPEAVVASLPARFRRDDEVLVDVFSDDLDADPASISVRLGAERLRFLPEGPCDAGVVCGRVRLRLASVEARGTEAQLEVIARMDDFSGNGGSKELDGGLPLTRLAWALSLCPACELVGPALSPVGTLVVVANVADGGGEFIEVTPDGGVVSRRPTIQGNAVATTITGATPESWIAIVTRQTRLRQRFPAFGFYSSLAGADGGTNGNVVCAGTANQSVTNFIDVPALSDPGPAAGLIGTQSYFGLDTRLGRFSPSLCPANLGSVGGIQGGGMPANLALTSGASTGLGFVLDVNAGLTGFNRTVNADPSSMLTRGATFDGGGVGLAVAPGLQPLVAFSTSNELVVTAFPSTVARVPGVLFSRPIFTDAGVSVVDGATSRLRSFIWLGDGGLAEQTASLPGFSQTKRPASPIGGEREIYAIDDTARVFAVAHSDGGIVRFDLPPTLLLGAQVGEATLWCRPGRSNALFVYTTANGYLVALIVDSARVDPNAAWPMAFHDTRNTNAADTREAVCP